MKLSYSRKFPALFPHWLRGKQGIGLLIVLFLGMTSLILGVLLLKTYQAYSGEKSEIDSRFQKLVYWEDVITKHPQFPAAYYEAAVYAAQLKQTEKALNFVQKALQIDPNFFEAEVLAKELQR